ncbi:hypothetical protein BIY28_18505 [Brenneria goodwinii]|nr:hypothetical protein BIY28_18505 [Brenneria goodwinii]
MKQEAELNYGETLIGGAGDENQPVGDAIEKERKCLQTTQYRMRYSQDRPQAPDWLFLMR